MSSFICEHCGQEIIDSESGYRTGCKHYPLEEKRRKKSMEWISVKDRLPEDEQKIVLVLCLNDVNNYCMPYEYDQAIETGYILRGVWYSERSEGVEKLNVTHWMLLPTPPKKIKKLYINDGFDDDGLYIG